MTKASTEVAVQSPEELALINQQESEFDDSLFQTPILKIGQPLTREVQNEQAEAGEFINTLTGEGLGDKLSFIVSYYQKGRFATNDGRAFVAFGDTIPESWADLVGEEFVGTPFTEYPDAEEQFKTAVNAKEREWGKGPIVSTTHNFTGLAIVEPVEGEDGEAELQPVRLSLQRTNMPAVRKLLTLKRAMLRGKPFWDLTFDLSTYKQQFDRGSAFLLNVKAGRKTESDERSEAMELASAVAAGRVTDNAESADAPSARVEPKAKGGAAV